MLPCKICVRAIRMLGRDHDVTFRKLGRQDTARYAAHLRRLGAADRRARFMGELAPRAISRHIARLDWNRVVLLGCFVDGVLRGSAELHPGPDGIGEAAFAVEARYQGHGLGTELVRRLLVIARRRALQEVVLICLAGNARIRRIVTKLSGSVSIDGGEATAAIELLPANPATHAAELLDDGEALRRLLRTAGRTVLEAVSRASQWGRGWKPCFHGGAAAC